MKRVMFIGTIVAAWSLALVPPSARGEPPMNHREEIGEAVFEKLDAWLKDLVATDARESGRRPILAVLPPTDTQGRIPLFFAETSSYLEGEVLATLRRKTGERVVLWGPEALAGTLRAQGVEPREIKLDDENSVRNLLNRIGADAAVIGQMDTPDINALRDDTATPFPLIVRGVCRAADAPGPVAELTIHPDVVAPPWDNGKLSGRFGVEFLVNNKIVDLAPHPNPPEGVDGVFIAILDPDKQVGPTRSAPCSFRVKNFATKGIGLNHPEDAKRLFGVVLTIDGYNAVMEQAQEGKAGPSVYSKRAPENSRKYVLTGPGWRMIPDKNKKDGYDLVPSDNDGSSWEVKGFQDGPNMANQFVLTTNTESWVASSTDAAVGWITVHIFAQKLEDDVVADNGSFADKAGVMKGSPQIAQRTFPVRVDWYPRPVESWRIYYTVGRDGGEEKMIADALPLAR